MKGSKDKMKTYMDNVGDFSLYAVVLLLGETKERRLDGSCIRDDLALINRDVAQLGRLADALNRILVRLGSGKANDLAYSARCRQISEDMGPERSSSSCKHLHNDE